MIDERKNLIYWNIFINAKNIRKYLKKNTRFFARQVL